MAEVVQNCPLCGSSAFKPFDQREFRGHPVTNQLCAACGLVIQSPRMTEAESKAFYEAEYRRLYQGQEGPNPKDLAVQSARAEYTLGFIQPQVKKLSRILDIGCSTGLLLQHLRTHYQAQALGIEPGQLYRQYAQALNLEIYPSLEDLQDAGENAFDLICMMHVLEHLPDPVAYLQNLKEKLLTPAGWLLLEVPNLYAHDSFEVAHLVSFSSHSLIQVVQKSGYRITQLRIHGHPRSQLIPLYITLLAQSEGSQPHSVKPEHLVRTKRQVGFLRRRLVTRLFPDRAWLPIREGKP